MPTAVATTNFPVALVSDDGKSLKYSQVSQGTNLMLLSDRLSGITISGSSAYSGVMIMGGYLVQIEGQTVFVAESMLAVSN